VQRLRRRAPGVKSPLFINPNTLSTREAMATEHFPSTYRAPISAAFPDHHTTRANSLEPSQKRNRCRVTNVALFLSVVRVWPPAFFLFQMLPPWQTEIENHHRPSLRVRNHPSIRSEFCDFYSDGVYRKHCPPALPNRLRA